MSDYIRPCLYKNCPCHTCLIRGMCAAKIQKAYEESIKRYENDPEYATPRHITSAIVSLLTDCKILLDYSRDRKKKDIFGKSVLKQETINEIIGLFLEGRHNL